MNISGARSLTLSPGMFRLAVIALIGLCLSLTVNAQTYVLDPFISWSPDGSMIAVAHETTLQILDAETMAILNTITGIQVGNNGSAWSTNGNMIAIINGDNVEVWSQPWSSAHAQQMTTLIASW
jgi:Tol biopolymer transport system component